MVFSASIAFFLLLFFWHVFMILFSCNVWYFFCVDFLIYVLGYLCTWWFLCFMWLDAFCWVVYIAYDDKLFCWKIKAHVSELHVCFNFYMIRFDMSRLTFLNLWCATKQKIMRIWGNFSMRNITQPDIQNQKSLECNFLL